MSTEQIAKSADSLLYICGKHQLQLTHVLRGGAGHCASCSMFVQSANHSMPTLPPKPEQMKTKAKRAAKLKAKAGKRRSRKTRARKQAPTAAARIVGTETRRTERKQ